MANLMVYPTKCVDDIKAMEKSAIAIGPFGSRMKSDCYVSDGIPVIRGNNISDTIEFKGDYVHITEELADQLLSSSVYAGDLVFPHRGAIGEVGIIRCGDSRRYVLSTSLMKLTCDRKQVNPLFLFYFFRSKYGRHELLKNASQVGTPGISTPLTSLKEIKVPVPNLEEQKRISEILSSLDEKIELNRKQNRTLEAIAQALFKRWFVEFEFPDQNDQPYKSSGGAMQPSELGEIPVGWEIVCLGDVAANKKEAADPSSIPGDTPYVGLEHINRCTLGLSDWGTADDVTSNKSRFAAGNVLFGKLRTYFHKVAIAPHDGICSTDILVLQEERPEYYCFMVMLAFSEAFVNYSNNASTGTRMPRADWKHMKEYSMALPPTGMLDTFNEIILPSFKKIQINIAESRILANLRDTLLPKLMSGELRVGDTA